MRIVLFPGGPLSVRGFDLRGIGPSSDGNSLGGSLYWASGLHLYAPLPFKPGQVSCDWRARIT